MNNMNEIKEVVKTQEEKIDKIKTLTVFLMDLEKVAKSELLSPETRDQCQPIIKAVMEKLNQISKQ